MMQRTCLRDDTFDIMMWQICAGLKMAILDDGTCQEAEQRFFEIINRPDFFDVVVQTYTDEAKDIASLGTYSLFSSSSNMTETVSNN